MLVDEALVRKRIERTDVSDAKKRASYPLAKRAGARCAVCVQTHEEVRVERGGRHGSDQPSREELRSGEMEDFGG